MVKKLRKLRKKLVKNPKDFVDSFIDAYKNIWKLYDIDYTKFIRTTDEYHVKAVQALDRTIKRYKVIFIKVFIQVGIVHHAKHL